MLKVQLSYLQLFASGINGKLHVQAAIFFSSPVVVTLVIFCRNRMQLGSTQAFYLLVNNRSILSLSKTMAEVYSEHQDDDGFLHVTYASQEVFGSGAAGP